MIGSTVSHYRIVDRLGSGGMGVVFKAEDLRLVRPVALKFLPESLRTDADSLERFRREARAASALNHPNICTIYDIGEHEGQPFIVMEFLDGAPLRSIISGYPLKRSQVFEIGIQIADALEAAHASGIVHRDIKPANIFITRRGQAKILDFGLAKLAADGPAQAGLSAVPTMTRDPYATSPGVIVGTVAYMSPEQARAEPLDARSDLFNFGAVLYEMATGQMAFTGKTPALIFAAILGHTPSPADRINSDVQPELGRIISKALEKERELRYQTVADLRSDLIRLRRATESGQSGTPEQLLTTLAVLPFRDLLDEAGSDVWGIGMADAIIGRLATLQHLAVRPTSSVIKYAKAPVDSGAVARELEVESVLDGTFHKVGNVIRVSVQLSGGQQRATRWAERYDLRADDMLRFQDEVAQRVVDGLKVQVSTSERASLSAPITGSSDAYDLYLQARFHWTEYSVHSMRSSLQSAERLLEQAIALDGSFAHAHALLGLLLAMETANFPDPGAQNLRHAERSANEALRLDSRLVDGWIALGTACAEGGRNEEAIRALRTALDLAPNAELALDMLGYAYHYAGLNDLAEASYRRARSLNPTSRRLHWVHGRMLLYVGRTGEAIALMHWARGMKHAKGLAHLGKFLYYAGQVDEAERVFLQATEAEPSKDELSIPVFAAYVFASRGERHRIDPRVFAARHGDVMDGDMAYWIGGVHALLGEKESAIAWFQQAVDLGNHNYPWFSRDRNYDALRGDSGYEEILEIARSAWERYRQQFA
jgi:non-specific serine/threonine protein kinase